MKAKQMSTLQCTVALFLIFAFGMPLLCVLCVKNFDFFQTGTPNLILYGFEAITPSLSAILVIVIVNGRTEVSAFLKRSYIENIKFKSIILAVAVPLLMGFAAKLTSTIIDGYSTELFSRVKPQKLLIIMWALVAEEIGWCGFLQDKLDKKYKFPLTPILIGVIWGLWHYHFFWLGTLSAPVLLFFAGCIAESFAYYWITKRSNGNIIPASIWHFRGNFAFGIFSISPEHNGGSELPYLIYVVFMVIMAVAVILHNRHSSRFTYC